MEMEVWLSSFTLRHEYLNSISRLQKINDFKGILRLIHTVVGILFSNIEHTSTYVLKIPP